jgi:Flp pilus assembly pilin Flp
MTIIERVKPIRSVRPRSRRFSEERMFKAAQAARIPGLTPHVSLPASRAASCTPGGALERTEGGELMFRDFFRRIHVATLNLREDKGQTMAEYGVVLAVITLGVVVALGLLSGDISKAINSVRTNL